MVYERLGLTDAHSSRYSNWRYDGLQGQLFLSYNSLENGRGRRLFVTNKFAGFLTAVVALLLTPAWQRQDVERDACIQRCITPSDPELHRQEIISLEREAAHAIQLRNGTFFRRVYGDDFAGTLSHGQQVNRSEWVAAIESGAVQYDWFNASDIKVQIYRDTAVVTCLWSARGMMKGQRLSRQMRVIHVYLNTASGWRVVSGQITSLPPDIEGLL
jgi:Domain of unknown function (DUF4440)